jgi:uncharacterized membrane protein YeaQ/YmgE (transglycosylase-associated protein family)
MELVLTLALGAACGWAFPRGLVTHRRHGTLEAMLLGMTGSGLGVFLAAAAGNPAAGLGARALASLAGAAALLF